MSAFVLQIYIKLLILLAESVGLFHLAESVSLLSVVVVFTAFIVHAQQTFTFATRDTVQLKLDVYQPVTPRPDEKYFPFQSDLPYWRSRVTPDVSSTMALRDSVSRLKSVDLPTLGRPTIATMLLMLLCSL